MPEQPLKFLDVKKVQKTSSPNEKKFWAEKKEQPASHPISPWLYGLLFAAAFAVSIITTTLIANRSTQPTTTSRVDSQVHYEPQSKAGDKNPFTQNTDPVKPDSLTPPSTPNPEPAEPTIDKKSIRLRVLNGNGVAGDANKMKLALEQAGFTVSATGNAQFGYTKTQVYYVSGKQKEADLVASVITNKEAVLTEAAASVVGDATDVLVVVGKK